MIVDGKEVTYTSEVRQRSLDAALEVARVNAYHPPELITAPDIVAAAKIIEAYLSGEKEELDGPPAS